MSSFRVTSGRAPRPVAVKKLDGSRQSGVLVAGARAARTVARLHAARRAMARRAVCAARSAQVPSASSACTVAATARKTGSCHASLADVRNQPLPACARFASRRIGVSAIATPRTRTPSTSRAPPTTSAAKTTYVNAPGRPIDRENSTVPGGVKTSGPSRGARWTARRGRCARRARRRGRCGY